MTAAKMAHRYRSTAVAPPVPLGNQYDKYHTRNPLARLLMGRFLRDVSELYEACRPLNSVLEVGCGEGLLTAHLARRSPQPERFEACDLSLDRLEKGLDPKIRFRQASIYELPYQTNEFELVVCCEVLEHLEDPERGLVELCRVARHAVLLSTPREPLFRCLNLLRLAHLSAWGNSPGHLQHFGRRDLLALAGRHLSVTEVRSPTPWTVVLGRV